MVEIRPIEEKSNGLENKAIETTQNDIYNTSISGGKISSSLTYRVGTVGVGIKIV